MTECSRGDGWLMSSRTSRTAAMMEAAITHFSLKNLRRLRTHGDQLRDGLVNPRYQRLFY